MRSPYRTALVLLRLLSFFITRQPPCDKCIEIQVAIKADRSSNKYQKAGSEKITRR